MATDTERRKAAIRSLSWRRTLAFFAATIMFVSAVVSALHRENAVIAMGCAVMGFMITFQFGSDLHLLMTIDRLQDNSRHDVATQPPQPTSPRADGAASRG